MKNLLLLIVLSLFAAVVGGCKSSHPAPADCPHYRHAHPMNVHHGHAPEYHHTIRQH